MTEKPVSGWVLVAANLVPLAGVVLWGWDAFVMIALFWMESVVVGAFFALRMLCVEPRDLQLWAAKLGLVPFFCSLYGMYTAMHGMFVFDVLGDQRYGMHGPSVVEPAMRTAGDYGLWLPLAALMASHGFSFLWNYLYHGEFRRAQLVALMGKAAVRVLVLQIVTLIGAFAAIWLGSPLWALVALLGLKITLDFKAHVKEHSKA